MRSEELVASGDLAADGFAAVTRQIRAFHGGIAERVFTSIGTSSEPIKLIHDGIADTVYGAVAVGGSLVVRAGTRIAAVTRAPGTTTLDDSPRARFLIGAVNGAFGDALHERNNGLATTMAVRVDGRAIAPRDFPGATPKLAIFLHGLCETEDIFGRDGYGARLRAELGYTPVYIRYNSGLKVDENGRLLAALLGDLEWPVPIAEIVLIGHSMGGLVAQSACGHGAQVRAVVSIGSPYTGSWLERAAHDAERLLARLPETRALAQALGARSAGVRDMRGTIETHFIASADHYFVAATLTRDPSSQVANTIGDLLVSRPSAWAETPGEGLRFDVDNYISIGPANHFDLFNHPAVADQLVEWLTAESAGLGRSNDRSGRGRARAGLAARSAAAVRGLPRPKRSRRRWS